MRSHRLWLTTFSVLLLLAFAVAACTPQAAEETGEPMTEVENEDEIIILRVGTGDSGEGLNTPSGNHCSF